MILAPPVVPARVALTATPVVVAVSATDEPLQGRGVVYIYATVRAFILFGPTNESLIELDWFAIPFGKSLQFNVSPLSSYLSVSRASTTDGALYWYLVGENSA